MSGAGWGQWGQWSSCSLSCGGGQWTRSRYCKGPDCPHTTSSQTRICNSQPCQHSQQYLYVHQGPYQQQGYPPQQHPPHGYPLQHPGQGQSQYYPGQGQSQHHPEQVHPQHHPVQHQHGQYYYGQYNQQTNQLTKPVNLNIFN